MQKSIGENMWIFAVAALAAAWIEIRSGNAQGQNPGGRGPCGRVD